MPGLDRPEAGAGAEDPGPADGAVQAAHIARSPQPEQGPDAPKPEKDADTPATEALDLILPFALEPDEPEASAPAPVPAPASSRFRRGRVAFRHWRRTRAFWGGFLLVLSGSEILYTYNAPFKVVIHFGLYGIAGFALPALVLLLGTLVWFDPEHRVFYSILALFASAGTWLTSNLGGFFIGMLLGLSGATLTYGWSNAPTRARRQKRTADTAQAETALTGTGDQGPRAATS